MAICSPKLFSVSIINIRYTAVQLVNSIPVESIYKCTRSSSCVTKCYFYQPHSAFAVISLHTNVDTMYVESLYQPRGFGRSYSNVQTNSINDRPITNFSAFVGVYITF